MIRQHNQMLRRDRRGTAAVEFGFTAPLVILALVGCIELGRAFWIRAALQFAAEETARLAMVDATADDQILAAHAQSRLFGVAAQDATFSVARETVGGVEYVSVTGEYPFKFLSGLIADEGATLSGAARAAAAQAN
ncbi:MAG TPA: pilus assembly protein [Azospirillaceae bacterium]|nr:pilus assembly protein [Azospirillaceae bacterium]